MICEKIDNQSRKGTNFTDFRHLQNQSQKITAKKFHFPTTSKEKSAHLRNLTFSSRMKGKNIDYF